MAVCFGMSMYAASGEKVLGDQAYSKGQYQQAIQIYTGMLKHGANAYVYYNLGNCYYRTKDIAKSVLCYERAHLLNPGDGDIKANLALAKSKTADKTVAASTMFFVQWWNDLTDMKSSDQWSHCAIGFFIVMLAGFALYIFSNAIRAKKLGFGIALICLAICVLSNIFAYRQKTKLVDQTGAVVMTPVVTVRSTPSDGGTALFVVHKGHVVSIKDNSMRYWKEIQLEDGNMGWMKTSDMEII